MASGDITATLLSRVRTFLDESAAGFWQDTEIYRALTDAQIQIINHILTIYKAKIAIRPNEELPEILRSLMASTTGTGTDDLPANFLYDLAVYITASGIPVLKRSQGRTKASTKNSTLLASSATQPYYSISGTEIVLETSVIWTLEYLHIPTDDIDATHDPLIPKLAYNVLARLATANMLMKDENPEAQNHYSIFLKEIQDLY